MNYNPIIQELTVIPSLAIVTYRWEIGLILILLFLAFGVKHLHKLGEGLKFGFREFVDEVDSAAFDAGRSIGGIHGKEAAQAVTPDNQTAELYDSDALKKAAAKKHLTKTFFTKKILMTFLAIGLVCLGLKLISR